MSDQLIKWAGRGVMLAPLLFLLLFFFYPLGSILELSFSQDGGFDLSIFREIFSESYYRQTLWFTVWQATVSTLLTLALAVPAAHVFAKYHFPAKSILLGVATLPFVLPTVVVAMAFSAFVGEDGLLNYVLMNAFGLDTPPLVLERTLLLIFIAHVFYNYAVAVRIISSFWATQNQRIQQAAQVLGANSFQVFYRITLPLLMPAIAAAAALVFMFTFTSFGVILLLGGLRYATLEIEIYNQAISLFNLPAAAALSLIQLITTLLMMVVYAQLQERMNQPLNLQAARRVAKPPKTTVERAWVVLNLLIMVGLIFLPMLALVERSLTVGLDAPSLHHYAQLAEPPEGRMRMRSFKPILAVGQSLQFAVVAMVFSTILGTLAAYLLSMRNRFARWLDPIFMLPLATSAVTLGFGFIIALDEPPLNLRTSFWIYPIAHTLVAMPFVVRTVLPSLQSIRPSLRESAAVLGAPLLRRWWRIDVPLLSRSLFVGATFAFTISMGEFGASLFIARSGDQPTIPIVIFRLLSLPGISNYGQALAMSVVLMVVCAVGFTIVALLNRVIIGEF